MIINFVSFNINSRLYRLCENRKTKLFYNTALLLPQAGVFHLPAYVRRRAGGKHQHEANDALLKNYSIKFVFTQPVKSWVDIIFSMQTDLESFKTFKVYCLKS